MTRLRSFGWISAALALVATLSSALAPVAQARGDRGPRVSATTVWGHGGPHGYGFEHGWSGRNSYGYGWSPSYRISRGYGYGYGSDWRHNRWYHRDHRRGGYYRDGNADEVIGGVILGAIGLAVLSSAINSNRARDAGDDDPAPRDRRGRGWDDGERGGGTWADPDGVPYPPSAPPPAAAAPSAACAVQREYQTTVTVGGEPVKAYGMACRQADGTWRLGPIERTDAGPGFGGGFDPDE
jgi:hypothetical protein